MGENDDEFGRLSVRLDCRPATFVDVWRQLHRSIPSLWIYDQQAGVLHTERSFLEEIGLSEQAGGVNPGHAAQG